MMRWKQEHDYKRRTKTRFLLFPLRLKHETRWLEWATWVQISNGYQNTWADHDWVNK